MLLLSGCSYTDNEDFPSIAFGRRVYNKSLCKILARGGAGNHYIARSILDNITPDVDKVFILWSGLSRLDLEFPIEMKHDVSSYYEGSPLHVTGDTIWFHTGGYDGTWHNHSRTKYSKYVHEFIKNQYLPLNWNYLVRKNLRSIIGCLNTLEQKNIEYRFGFIYDIFQDYSDSQQSLGGPVDRNEPLLDLINWNKFLPTTPYEFCTSNNLLSSDGFHPSNEGFKQWWNSVSHLVPFTL
jgi:hypothetical protein